MSVTVDSLPFANPSHTPCSRPPLRRASIASSLRFDSHSLNLRRLLNCSRFYTTASSSGASSPKGLGLQFSPLTRSPTRYPSLTTFAASRDDSKHPGIGADGKNDIDSKAKESEEAWKQTLESFKEQALKMQSVSQEAYDLYSKKAMVILKDTAVQFKLQADKAGYDLSVIAKEVTEDGKEYLSAAAENSPEPLKDVVETFATSAYDLNEISKVYDFYLGIPYGLLLSVGGFLCFMLTGSISAIRFGVILGSALLALSVSSLRSWKRGESFVLALKGQTAIAGLLFLRELRLLSLRHSVFGYFTTFISGAMLAFYLYRIILSNEQPGGSNLQQGSKK